jgi:nucleoid DNA-binding protein
MRKITYTKKDIINRIKSNYNISIEESKTMLEIVLDSIKDFLLKPKKNYRIEIRDFGVFEVKPTKPRDKARNPKILQIFKVPARRKLSSKAGKSIKNELKKKLYE